MKLQGLLVATMVLAVLSGALYWSNHRKAEEDSPGKVSPDAPGKILALNQADVSGLAVLRKEQPEVDLSRSGSGSWQITAPEPLAADQEAVAGMLATLCSLNSQRLVEDQATDLAQYGLASPALEVAIALKGGKSQKLRIGQQTPAGNAYYAMLAGDPRLFTVAGYDKNSLDKTANDLRDKRLLTADFEKVSQMELTVEKPGGKQDITFARNKEAWQILKPRPWRADTSRVEDLVRLLQGGRIDAGGDGDEAKNAAAFPSASLVALAKVTDASGTQELEVRKTKTDTLARSSVLSGVYKVPAALATGLDKSLDDFRNKKLFDFDYRDPDKVEFHDGSKSYFLTRAGSDWRNADAKKVDEAALEALVGKIRELSGDKFVDSGFTTPALELTVSSDDSKRVEKVLIAKNGQTYIAKRENEPALYEISSSAISDLEKAAADLKPAGEAKN
ncbi:MAG: DUF4340 domain-containing protein [Candidatus Acidiferrum sp.]|jgi:hypothetical protein